MYAKTTQNSLHIQISFIACQDINTNQNARSWRNSQRTFLQCILRHTGCDIDLNLPISWWSQELDTWSPREFVFLRLTWFCCDVQFSNQYWFCVDENKNESVLFWKLNNGWNLSGQNKAWSRLKSHTDHVILFILGNPSLYLANFWQYFGLTTMDVIYSAVVLMMKFDDPLGRQWPLLWGWAWNNNRAMVKDKDAM